MKNKTLKSFCLYFVLFSVSLLLINCNYVELKQKAESNDDSAVSPENIVSNYAKASRINNSSDIKNLIIETPQSVWREKAGKHVKTDEPDKNITVDENYSQPKLGKFIYEQILVDFPDFVDRNKLTINSVRKVAINENKCRVTVIFESDADPAFIHSMKAEKNFYLYKTENGWKIFDIMDVGDTSDFPF